MVRYIALTILVFYCGIAAQPEITVEEADTSYREPDSSSSSKIELIDQKHYTEITTWLKRHEYALSSSNIVSMGLESTDTASSEKKLFVITLGTDGQPQKKHFPIDSTFYASFSSGNSPSVPNKDTILQKTIQPVPPYTHQIATVDSTQNEKAVTSPSLQKQNTHREDGRLYFMLNTTIRSISVYSTSFSVLLESPDPRTIPGLSLLSLGAGLWGSYSFTKTLELGYGRVEFMNYGGDMGGIWYPVLLELTVQSLSREFSKPYIWGISSMIGFPAGIIWGSRCTAADNYAYGNAGITTNLSRIAPLYGFFLPGIFISKKSLDSRAYGATASILSMVGIPAGFYIGKKIIGNRDISTGRSIMTTASGILGAGAGALLPTLVESTNHRVYFSLALLGHAAGITFGFNYKKDQDYTFSQGIFTIFTAGVGIGVGTAIPLLASADSHKPYVIAGILGCYGGYVLGEKLSRTLFEQNPHDNRRSKNTPSVSFPGLASLPFFIGQHFFSSTKMKDQTTACTTYLPNVTLVDMRF